MGVWWVRVLHGSRNNINGVNMSIPMKQDDPAYWMLKDNFVTVPTVHRDDCYICTDPEFAQMGMPLCKPWCHVCPGGGHMPADDDVCSDCGTQVDRERILAGDLPKITIIEDEVVTKE